MDESDYMSRYESSPASATMDRQRQVTAHKDLGREKQRQAEERENQELRERELQQQMARERQRERQKSEDSDGRQNNSVGLVIGNQLTNPDPVSKNIKRNQDYFLAFSFLHHVSRCSLFTEFH